MAGFLTFDTLQYVKSKEAGVEEQVAEVQAEALKEIIEDNLATKQDIRDLKRDIATLNMELKRDIEIIKKDLTIRLGGMMVVGVSILSVLITLLNRFH